MARAVELWHAPSIPNAYSDDGLEFAPFVRHRVLAGHHDTVQSLQWSGDSRFFLSSAKDLTARVWSWSSDEDFTPTTLGGHKEAVLGAWFSQDQELACCLSLGPVASNSCLRSIPSVRTVLCFNGTIHL